MRCQALQPRAMQARPPPRALQAGEFARPSPRGQACEPATRDEDLHEVCGLCSRKRMGRGAWAVVWACRLLLSAGPGALPTHVRASVADSRAIAVPSPGFPSIQVALEAARRDAVGRTIVLGDGRHDVSPSASVLALRQPLRLEAAHGLAPEGVWKARLRGWVAQTSYTS